MTACVASRVGSVSEHAYTVSETCRNSGGSQVIRRPGHGPVRQLCTGRGGHDDPVSDNATLLYREMSQCRKSEATSWGAS